MTDLGTLGGSGGVAYAINGSGQVVGNAYTAGDAAEHAFLYGNGVMQDLGTLGGNSSAALAINASGQVVGSTDNGAFLYTNGTMTNIGNFIPSGINDGGQVAGSAFAGGGPHACIYNNGTLQDLGALGGTFSLANAINDSGQVVGKAQIPGPSGVLGAYYHAFLYSAGGMTELGTLAEYYNSDALGVNANGQAVGVAYNSADIFSSAFLYSNGAIVDLNTLIDHSTGWTLEEANAINNNGWIVGSGVNPNGDEDAFLLTPTPEPSTFVLLCAGGLALLTYACRKRPL